MKRTLIILLMMIFSAYAARAALVVGTNVGFVETAPSADPVGGGGNRNIDGYARSQRYTSPAQSITVTEIGWWANDATDDGNYEVAIYDDGTDDPENLVGVSRTNAKGTTAGWKRSTGLNIQLEASTVYWIAVQLDDITDTTNTDWENLADDLYFWYTPETTLQDPWTNTGSSANTLAFYALWEAAGDSCTPPAAGNYAVDCSDNCAWSSADTIPANITMTGTGVNILSAAWTFTGSSQWINIGPGCEFNIDSGGEFK